MNLTTTGSEDRTYAETLAWAMPRFERRVRQGKCASCGVLTPALVCERLACWDRVASLPLPERDRLLVLAYQRPQHPMHPWRALGGIVISAAGIMATLAMFTLLLWPAVRLLAVGAAGRLP